MMKMMNLKSKIYAGLAILILVIAIVAAAGIYNLKVLSDDSSAIIQDNYHTIDYSFMMLAELDSINSKLIKISQTADNESIAAYTLSTEIDSHLISFGKILQLQKNNITEPGEDALVKSLVKNYELVNIGIHDAVRMGRDYLNPSIVNSLNILRNTIHEIYKLNMQSIINKNNIAEETSSNAITYMLVITSLSLVIVLLYIFRFPKYLIAPIRELTHKMQAVSSRRYDQKINIKSHDEIGTLTESFNLMAERLKSYEEQHLDQLLLEKKRIDSLVNGLNDGVILLDENNNIILINTSAQQILALDSTGIHNQNIRLLGSRSTIVENLYSVISHIDDKDSDSLEIYDEKSKQYYNIDTIEIKSENKKESDIKIKGIIIILRNVTPFKEKDIAKTNMLAAVSHELKTPISSINLSLKLLSDSRLGNLNSEQENLVKSISQQNKRLLKVVNQVLDFAQAETGKINLVIEIIDPAQIIDLATSALMMQLSEKKIDLKLNITDNPPLIKADLEKSVWILVNILSNAIRYSSQEGIIEIHLQLYGNFIMYSVLDHGPGISETEKDRIFQKFMKDKAGYFKGTGLGLAIAKEFVESQGGKIWVNSREGSGCRFFFTLPLA